LSGNISDASTPPSGDEGYEENVEFVLQSRPVAPNPVTNIVSVAGNLSPNDLRMMHHWSTATWNTINVTRAADNVLLMHAPQLGFENDFLLNCILGISSLHMEYLNPNSSEFRQQTALYRFRALNSFRENLSSINLTSRGWEASLLTAILLVVLCSKDYDTQNEELSIISWLVLYRGLSAIITMRSYPEVQESKVGPIFRRELTLLQTEPVIPQILIKMVEGIGPLDPDFENLESYCNALDVLGNLYASLRQDGLTPGLYVRVVSWPSHLSEWFVNCAREKLPRPLIILAHYLVFTKLITHLWWLDGSADCQIKAIEKTVGPEWLVYLGAPHQARYINDPEELRSFLLR